MSESNFWTCKTPIKGEIDVVSTTPRCGTVIGKVEKRPKSTIWLVLASGVEILGLAWVPCPVCGKKQEWIPLQAAMDEMIANSKRKPKDQVDQMSGQEGAL